ncbi:uncharacterized protein DDB_G0285291-like [Kryptolebias marmoratus]|uniref:uncharacterized protein DDB_G0285291-like n=1 Tax=Kryptolebias marmoratus TaxID=37003 RepID=UPI0018ACBA8C|nr:uncharacterized protein DDB_G0285291-like [Kryptolebias marmoratus]
MIKVIPGTSSLWKPTVSDRSTPVPGAPESPPFCLHHNLFFYLLCFFLSSVFSSLAPTPLFHPFFSMHASVLDAPNDLRCLTGDEKSSDVDRDRRRQTRSREDNRNQNAAAPIANGHYLALVPGNRRPIDLTLAEHFVNIAPPPPASVNAGGGGGVSGEQLRRLERHEEELRAMRHRQEQERQKRQWLEEERLRLEQQKQLEKQRRELLQLQLQQQQQEHRHRRQVLQWQLELEQQYRAQQQLRRSPTGVLLSPSSGLCTIYEAMETSDEEDEAGGGPNRNAQVGGRRRLHPVPPRELEWNEKVDMVQQLINQTLMLSGDGGCPPLLLLPVGAGGTLSPMESSMWPDLPPQFSPPTATVTSVSSYSPDSRGSSPSGDWTVVEVETQH